MTSASELFYSRRSRVGRNSDPFEESGFESPSGSDRAASRRHRIPGGAGHTRRQEGCDTARRGFVGQRQQQPAILHRPHPFQDREPNSLEGGGRHFPPANDGGGIRPGGGERLPRAVVLARERLLQRLSGVSLSDPRRNNGVLTSNPSNEIATGEDLRAIDAGDWDTDIPRNLPASLLLLTRASKRSSGLTPEAINRLPKAVFTANISGELSDEATMLKECSICLETFSDGDELIGLNCGHRYHVSCLVPWISTCGDCPYCRRKIDGRIPGI